MQTPITDPEILAKIDQILALVSDSVHKDELIDKMHADMMKNRKGIVEEVRTPVLNSLIKVASRLQAVKDAATKLAANSDPKAFERLSGLVDAALEFALSELDADFNVEMVLPAHLDKFDRKLHAAIETHPTAEKQLDGHIASCSEPGYRDLMSDRVINPAKVTVYKYFALPEDEEEITLDTHSASEPAPAEAPAEAPTEAHNDPEPEPTSADELPAPTEAPAPKVDTPKK